MKNKDETSLFSPLERATGQLKEPHFNKSKRKGTFREVLEDMGILLMIDDPSQESGRWLLKGECTGLYQNEKVENEPCPRNPGLLVVTDKIGIKCKER